MPRATVRWVLPVLALVALSCGCAQLGYSDRVLWRVPSPDGKYLAVCQEVPQFDGPGYDVRLERPDGTRVRGLYQIGDGDPCHEVAWSPDGRTLAVLSGHVARVRFVDVAWALDHPAERVNLGQVELSDAAHHVEARALRFIDPLEIELQARPGCLPPSACPEGAKGPYERRRLAVRLPAASGRTPSTH